MQRSSDLLSLVAVAGLSGLAGLYLIPAPNGDYAVEFAPAAALLNQGATVEPAKRTYSSTAPTHRPKARVTAQVATAPANRQNAWTTVVLADPSSTADHLKSPKPGDPMARAELTRDLQRELTRVGCYGGYSHGYWTQSTRRAMAVFMDRMNASLPIAEPDYIQLALIKGQGGIVCGAECPAGEVETENGRCVPRAVVAQASRREQRVGEYRRGFDADEPRRVAELRHGATAIQPPVGAVASAQVDVLPWQNQNRAFAEAIAERPVEPPPGRMAVGGPLPPPSAAVTAPAVGISAATAPNPALAARSGNALDRRAALESPTSTGAAATAPVIVGADGMVIPVDRIGKRSATAPKRKKYYAGGDGYSGKSRRGLPRRGSLPYIVMQSLGGFHQ